MTSQIRRFILNMHKYIRMHICLLPKQKRIIRRLSPRHEIKKAPLLVKPVATLLLIYPVACLVQYGKDCWKARKIFNDEKKIFCHEKNIY